MHHSPQRIIGSAPIDQLSTILEWIAAGRHRTDFTADGVSSLAKIQPFCNKRRAAESCPIQLNDIMLEGFSTSDEIRI